MHCKTSFSDNTMAPDDMVNQRPDGEDKPSEKNVVTSVGTLLGNTRLEKTRTFLHGRVLARNYSKR